MVTRGPALCDSCARRHDVSGYDPVYTCDAYPRAIPSEIINLGADHRLPRDDQDNDVVYKMIPGFESIFNMWAGLFNANR